MSSSLPATDAAVGPRPGERDQAFLLEASAALASSRQISTVIQRLSRKILEVVPAGRAGILLLESGEDGAEDPVPAGREPVVLAAGYEARFDRGHLPGGRRLRAGDYPELGRARETREPVVIEDVRSDPLMQPVLRQLEPTGLRSLLCVPLQTPERFFGILSIGAYDQVRSFTRREVDLCRTLANQAAVALENARLYDELRQLNKDLEGTVRARTARLSRALRQMTALNEIVHRAASSVAPEELTRRAVELLRESFDVYAALLAFHDEREGRFRIVASCAEEPLAEAVGRLEQRLDQGICGHVVSTGRSYFTGDTRSDPYYMPTPLEDTRSELCVPLHIGEQVVGVLDIQSTQPMAFHDEDRVALEAVADALGVAVRSAELLAHTERARGFLDAVIDNMTGGLIVTDRKGVVRRTNQRARDILGFAPGEMEGRSLAETCPDAAPMLAWQEAPAGRELTVRRRDGREVPLGYSNSFFAAREGGMDAVVLSFQDLSEVKALQARVRHRERLATIGQVATAVAHEVRNPLFGISSAAQTLQRTQEDPATRELLQVLLSETRRLDGLVEQLLAYGRPGEPERRPVDLADLCRQVVRLQRDLARERGLELECRLPEELVARVDPEQVKGAVLNLVRNALDAAEGHVVLELWGEAGAVRLEVSDDGPGVEPEDRDRIFDLYFTTKGGAGSGMGLPLCRKVARDHGGELTCHASEGGGARFRMELPSVEEPGETAADAGGPS